MWWRRIGIRPPARREWQPAPWVFPDTQRAISGCPRLARALYVPHFLCRSRGVPSMKQSFRSRWPLAIFAAAAVSLFAGKFELNEAKGGPLKLLREGKTPGGKGPVVGLLLFVDVGCGIGPAVATASPLGAANENSPPCGSSAGAGSDLTFRWTA